MAVRWTAILIKKGLTMSEFNLSRDVHVAYHMAITLSDYVRQDELYYPIEGNLPRMTIGGLLLRLRRINFFQMQLSFDQVSMLQEIETLIGNVQGEWSYHYTQKVSAETKSRLGVIEYFLDECTDSTLACRDNYRTEAMRRTIVQELVGAVIQLNVDDYQDILDQIAVVDAGLRAVVGEADFLWDEELRPAYPQDVFWWLYSYPIQEPEEAS